MGNLLTFVKNLPSVLRLIVRAMRSPRISNATKSKILVSGLYVCSPIDLVPELLLGRLGYVDDLLIIVSVLDGLFNFEDPEVIRDLWPGRSEELLHVQQGLRKWGGAIDRWARPPAARVCDRMFGQR